MDCVERDGEIMKFYYGVLGSGRSLGPQALRRWNYKFLVFCIIGLSLDPFFCYTLVFNGQYKCLRLDTTLGILIIVMRSIIDLFYVFHIILLVRACYFILSSQASRARFGIVEEMAKERRATALRYLFFYLPADILVILPLPQVVIFAIIPNLNDPRVFSALKSLNFIFVFQYVLRALRICSLLRKVTRSSGILAGNAWVNLFLYMLASHVVGAFWYLFSVQRKATCWREACKKHVGGYCSLFCNHGNTLHARTFLMNSCSTKAPDSTLLDFGIYLDALESGVVDNSAAFVQRISYCFWWGLQNLSSLGQGLKPSTYVWEIYFAVFVSISGLVLFSSLIGNMQTYLQLKTASLAEMRSRERETEYCMAFYTLPQDLKNRIRESKKGHLQVNTGVRMEKFFLSLPRDIRRDTKRHICMSLILRVPMFKNMDEQLLGDICDRLKPVINTETSFIFREGDRVDEILFIMRGRLLIKTYSGRTGFFKSEYLEAGDFCGEELLTWALDPRASANLPSSTRFVQALSEVEAFALKADDLKFIASQFRQLYRRQSQHIFRLHSEEWRTWAACCIKAAWRRYLKTKLEKSLRKEEKRLQDALAKAGGSSPSLVSTIHALRFAANALGATRRSDDLRHVVLEKPAAAVLEP